MKILQIKIPLICWLVLFPFLGYSQFKENYEKEHGDSSRFKTMIEVGVLVGQPVSSTDYTANYQVQFIGAYEVKEHFLAGIGTGPEIYQKHIGVPLYLNLQGYLSQDVLQPFIYANAGYGFTINKGTPSYYEYIDETKGGYRLNPGVGLEIPGKKTNLYLSIGYLQQKVNYIYHGTLDFNLHSSSNVQNTRIINPFFNGKIIEERLIRRGVVQLGIKF